MKMHILAAAFLTALAARGASASSEGGDTWSALEPVQRSTLVLQAPPPRCPVAWCRPLVGLHTALFPLEVVPG